jgi:predicted nucleic acid-binding protein
MSSMSADSEPRPKTEARREFVDANILVYAYDASAGTKNEVARELLARLWESRQGALSVQVLQEFFVTVTGKVPLPLSPGEAAERITELAAWHVFSPDAQDVLSAIDLHRQSQVAFWDAMILQAAAESGCSVLWTEDLRHGQELKGVRVQNPFAESGAG